GEGDPFAVGRPGWSLVQPGTPRQPPRMAPLGIHDVDLQIPIATRAKSDLAAIGRDGGGFIRTSRFRQALEVLTMIIDGGNLMSPNIGETEDHALAIGSKRGIANRGTGLAGAKHEFLLVLE